MMFIHDTVCISPQQSYLQETLFSGSNEIKSPVKNILYAIEPSYEMIPPGILRRMGRAVRLGIGAALPLTKKEGKPFDGIIIGTSMGGMEDCVKFLNQIIEYNEGTLTPTNFVQSTPNAIAGQLGLMTKNNHYNITHVHRGFSFENALLDVDMLLNDDKNRTYLVGAVDEISSYNYNIERLAGGYKTEPLTGNNLFNSLSPGTIAGEGAAMFIINGDAPKAKAAIKAVHIFQTENEEELRKQIQHFMQAHIPQSASCLLLSGENADSRYQHYYHCCESLMGTSSSIARFKHLSGEYPTASSFAVWLAAEILDRQQLPAFCVKKQVNNAIESVLVYNNYKGIQHSLVLLQKA